MAVDKGLLIERGVSALVVIAGVASCFMPFNKNEVEPSSIAADGEATADVVDVFGFSSRPSRHAPFQRELGRDHIACITVKRSHQRSARGLPPLFGVSLE